MENCDIKLSNEFDTCSSQCEKSLKDDSCQNCFRRNCRTALSGELGKDVDNETIECCVSKGYDNRPKPYDQFKGCFSECSGGVDTSSTTSDIFKNCCGSDKHQECCQKTCLTEGAYEAKLFPETIFRDNNDPITQFCQNSVQTKKRFGAKAIDRDDPNTKPYCRQSSEKDSEDPLFQCSCGQGPCDKALDWETCVLLNSETILNCLKGSNYSEAQLEEAKEELAQLFCQHQDMGFNCRSCLICNYLKYVNPQLEKPKVQLKTSVSSSKGLSTIERVFLGIGIVVIVLIVILLLVRILGRKRT